MLFAVILKCSARPSLYHHATLIIRVWQAWGEQIVRGVLTRIRRIWWTAEPTVLTRILVPTPCPRLIRRVLRVVAVGGIGISSGGGISAVWRVRISNSTHLTSTWSQFKNPICFARGYKRRWRLPVEEPQAVASWSVVLSCSPILQPLLTC